MLCKVTPCAGRISAYIKPNQLCWGGWEMGTAWGGSHTKCKFPNDVSALVIGRLCKWQQKLTTLGENLYQSLNKCSAYFDI